MKTILFFILTFGAGLTICAQQRQDQEQVSSTSSKPVPNPQRSKPLDDIVQRKIMQDRQVLSYSPIREADIFWEKRVWRIIDVREKMNQPFTYPKTTLFDIITKAAEEGKVTLYTQDDDSFSYQVESMEGILFTRDTVPVTNLTTEVIEYVPVENRINSEDIKRYRVKELWYFDENTSTMKVRILGIAPLKEVYDNNDNFRYETAMFWVYYPELRKELAKHKVFNPLNDRSLMSWEDLFEMRMFASTIYKASNVQNNRLQDYLSGVDLLLEADKIKQEIFNFEHDLWSY